MLPGVIGAIQANEALKILVGYGDPLVGRLLTFDAQPTRFGELKIKRDPGCPVCGNGVSSDGKVRATSEPARVSAAASQSSETCS